MDYHIDADNQILGRLASRISHLLQGKDQPKYNPRLASENKVFVKNILKMKISGRKAKEKIYYRYTGYVGHMKTRTYEEFFKKDPGGALKYAVNLMLPKNRLRAKRIKNLIIEK